MRVVALVVVLGLATPAYAESFYGPDKVRHLLTGTGLSLAVSEVTRAWIPGVDPFLTGSGTVFVFGAGKELFDLAGHGTASWWDFAWSMLGGFAGAAVSFAVDRLLQPPVNPR